MPASRVSTMQPRCGLQSLITAIPAVYSLQQSSQLAAQLQYLPQAVILPTTRGTQQCHMVLATAAHQQQQLLDWSFQESQQQKRDQNPHEQSRDQLQQHSQQPTRPAPLRTEQDLQQQQHKPGAARIHGKRLADGVSRSPAAGRSSPAAVGTSYQQHSKRQPHKQPHKPKQHSQLAGPAAQHPANYSKQQTAETDEYAAAQQRVRHLLVSADVNDPLAAAEGIPNTVNDIVIALQMLATAPRPSSMRAMKQYDQARLQLTAAVVQKFKTLLISQQQQQEPQRHMLLNRQQQQHQTQQKGRVASNKQQQQQQQQHVGEGAVAALTAALADLPPTKSAAATFALGVLRYYDTELVPALEEASGQIMSNMLAAAAAADTFIGSRQRTQTPLRAAATDARYPQQQQQHHLQQQQRRSPHASVQGYNANQLGQLVQGFVYLDHDLRSQWQQLFVDVSRKQLKYMKSQQLVSLAFFLMHYRYSSNSSSTGAAALGLYNGFMCAELARGAGGGSKVCLDAGWIADYLAAAAAAAAQPGGLKPSQLVPVMQAAAAMYKEWQQQSIEQKQQQQGTKLFGDLPAQMPSAAAAAGAGFGRNYGSSAGSTGHSSSSSSGSSDWVVVLLRAFQQQLPDLKLNHLAALLPALAALTQKPWTSDALLQLLLQVRLLLPAAAGPEVAAVAAAVVSLGAVNDIRSDQVWCDAYLYRLHAVMTTLGPSDLASTAHTLAQLRLKPYKAWRYDFCSRLRVEVKNMNDLEVVRTLAGLASIRVQLDPEVLHHFILRIKIFIGFMVAEDMKRLVGALHDMYRRPGGRSVLPGRTVQQLVDEMERRIKLKSMHDGMPL